MIILYTTHCPRCKVLETKLNNKNLEYTIVDNVLYPFKEANDWINEQEARA